MSACFMLAPRVDSDFLRLGSFFSGAFQDLCQTQSIGLGAVCAIGRSLGHALTYRRQFIDYLAKPCNAVSNYCYKHRISWVSPVLSIGAITVAAYAAHHFVPMTFLKAVICGIHSSALGILSAPAFMQDLGLESINDVIKYDLGFRCLHEIVKVDRSYTHAMSGIAFTVSSIGLAFLGYNPIIATSVGWITAMTVRIIALRIIAGLYLPKSDLFSLRRINELTNKYGGLYEEDFKSGNHQLLQAVCTDLENFNSDPEYTAQTQRDIIDIVKLIPMSLDSNFRSVKYNNGQGDFGRIHGVTPLVAACFNQNVQISVVEFLLQNGANPHVFLTKKIRESQPGQLICILEGMKLYNDTVSLYSRSGVDSGRINARFTLIKNLLEKYSKTSKP